MLLATFELGCSSPDKAADPSIKVRYLKLIQVGMNDIGLDIIKRQFFVQFLCSLLALDKDQYGRIERLQINKIELSSFGDILFVKNEQKGPTEQKVL